MAAAKVLYLLLAAVATLAVVAHAQQIPEVSRQELETALATETSASIVVQCIIAFQQGCDHRLMRIGELVPALLSNRITCAPPVCSKETAGNVQYFVKIMQKKYPKLWRKLITASPSVTGRR